MNRVRTILAFAAVLAFASFATAQTCQDIHGLGSNGCAPSPLDGTPVTVQGTVYVAAGTYNSGSVYFQCSGIGGMTFFQSGAPYAVGDQIEVSGIVGAFGDEIQINSATVTVLGAGSATPTNFTTGGLNAGTDLLGDFGCVEGVLTIISSGFNSLYQIDDGSGPCLVFVDGSTGIDQAFIDANYLGNYVRIYGATKCFDGVGEILPRNDGDFTLITVGNDDESIGSVKSRFDD